MRFVTRRELKPATVLECALTDLLSIAGYHISHLAVFSIALDRFIAVSYPVIYKKMCRSNLTIGRWILTIAITAINSCLVLLETTY
ncbi:hypothetical protein L596_020945 [Steinernema carpocapsae]|uniref:G-protein coupled receptors family 1 profile domain-containing protein n=1 Tax=Steinernema carpocapsae TaxID=34508 RepID=A0A4U5MV29_STECR|nr:hypothetical protein L596_020945 [Steinernema carpocapsae]